MTLKVQKFTLAQVQTMTREAATTTAQGVVLAARAAFAAETGGFVGAGEHADKAWPTWGDYARSLGVSPGRMTALRRQGRALALGIDPTDEKGDAHVWALLSQFAGDKAIGDVIGDEKATAAKIRTAVKKHARAKKGGATASRATTQADEKASVVLPRNVDGLVTLLEQVAAALAGQKVTPDTAERIAAVTETLSGVTVRPVAKKRSA